MADKKIVDLTAIVSQTSTDLYETSLNGAGSRKETRAQQNTYWNDNVQLPSSAKVTGLDAQLAAKGDVTGPASSTDEGFAVYNGTTGKVIKNNTMKPILLPFTYNNFGVTTDGTSNGTVCVPPSNNYVFGVDINRDLATNDAFTFLNSANADSAVYTIQNQATVPFPLGGWVDVISSSGAIITVAAGAGVTIRAPGNILTIEGLYSRFRVRRAIGDTWDFEAVGYQPPLDSNAKSGCAAATVGNLNATYAAGSDPLNPGVGASLTNAGFQEAFSADGALLIAGRRVLVWQQTNAFENGIYVVSFAGDSSTDWTLTRATDFDQSSNLSINCYTNVTGGTQNLGCTFGLVTSDPYDIGTTNLVFSRTPLPLTTKGDLFTRDTAVNARLPVGADGYILSANSSASTGMEWIPNTGESAITFSAYQTPQQTIPNNSETTVEFKQTSWNDGGDFSTSTYKYTAAQAIQQTFILKAAMAAPGGGDAVVTYKMYQNSTVVAEDKQNILMGELDRTFNLVKSLQLAQGDTVNITCTVTGNGGSGLSIANNQSQLYFQGCPQSVTYASAPLFVNQTGTSATMSPNTVNSANNASLVTLTLPDSASLAAGTFVEVLWRGAGGWKIAQNASDYIIFGDKVTTTGTGGYIQSSVGGVFVNGQNIRLVLLAANIWQVTSTFGNLDYV